MTSLLVNCENQKMHHWSKTDELVQKTVTFTELLITLLGFLFWLFNIDRSCDFTLACVSLWPKLLAYGPSPCRLRVWGAVAHSELQLSADFGLHL